MSREPNWRRELLKAEQTIHFTANDYARTWLVTIDADRNIVRVLGSWGVDPGYKPESPENPFVPASPDEDTDVRQNYAERIKRGY